jgi:hypothetical protein
MKSFISLFIVASLLVFSGISQASDAVSRKPRVKFEACDKDNKGALTLVEAQACWPNMSEKKFDAIDADKDGKITEKEFKAKKKKRAKKDKARTN